MSGSLGMLRVIIFCGLLFGSCGYALLKGRSDARIVAAVCLAAVFASWAFQSPVKSSYSTVEWGVLIVDVLAFIAFTLVALSSDRFWPLWVSGLQLTTILGHVFKAIDSSLLPLAYAVALRFWSYPILIIVAVAVLRSGRRAKRDTLKPS